MEQCDLEINSVYLPNLRKDTLLYMFIDFFVIFKQML